MTFDTIWGDRQPRHDIEEAYFDRTPEPGPTCPQCGNKTNATDLLCNDCAEQKSIDADDRWNHGGPDL